MNQPKHPAVTFIELHKARKGFTLIELLVVVTIIVVLLALLVPAMDKAVRLAELVKCQAQTRVISLASLDYATRNRGAIPLYDMWDTNLIYGFYPGFTLNDARDYLLSVTGRADVYYCPVGLLRADSPNVEWDSKVLTPTVFQMEMTYSLIGMWQPSQNQRDQYWPGWKTMYTDLPTPSGGTNRPSRLAKADNPSAIAMVVDSQKGYQSGVPGVSYPGHPTWSNAPGQSVYPHRRDDLSWEGTSSSFFDGHSEHRYFEEFFRPDAGYPHGARWFMWRGRGELNPESPYWW